MTNSLTQQGVTAARVGDIDEARRLLRKATQQHPDDVQAWLALAGVEESLDDKRLCFKQALEIAPDNEDAQAGLALIEQKLAEIAVSQAGATHCYRHPEIETSLRCNRCNKPICPKCAQRTPVGFRCPDCIREQENKYYSGGNFDYVIAAVVALPLSIVVTVLFSTILAVIWFGIFIAFFLAPAAAGMIAEAVRWAVGRRRSRYLGHVVATCISLPAIILMLFYFFNGAYFLILIPGMLAFIGAPTALARLR